MLGPKIDVSANQKKASGDDDVGDGGVSSAEPIAHNPICSGASK
jgi:hypothetical protein